MYDVRHEFGTIIEAPRKALDWLEPQLDGSSNVNKEHWNHDDVTIGRDETKLYVSTNCSCMPTMVPSLIKSVCEMQRKFGLETLWEFTWAETWESGGQWYMSGGAAVCYKGVAMQMTSPQHWIMETIAALKAKCDAPPPIISASQERQ